MARIMCTQKLWQRLRPRGRTEADVTQHAIPGVSLGPWAAKVFKDAGREFVLVLEERTYLTLVFAGAPYSQFRLNFATALVNALVDLGVPRAIVRMESAALDFEPLARLADPILVE